MRTISQHLTGIASPKVVVMGDEITTLKAISIDIQYYSINDMEWKEIRLGRADAFALEQALHDAIESFDNN